MEQNEFYEVNGCNWFIPVEINETYADAVGVIVDGCTMDYTLAVKEVYRFPKPHEPQKVTVPKFVADWVKEMKQDERPLYSVMSGLMNKTNHEWGVWKSANMNFSEIVAQAWIYGYTVEKEKLYTVEIPNPNNTSPKYKLMLVKGTNGVEILRDYYNEKRDPYFLQLTESEIKQDFDFLWKFAKEVE